MTEAGYDTGSIVTFVPSAGIKINASESRSIWPEAHSLFSFGWKETFDMTDEFAV